MMAKFAWFGIALSASLWSSISQASMAEYTLFMNGTTQNWGSYPPNSDPNTMRPPHYEKQLFLANSVEELSFASYPSARAGSSELMKRAERVCRFFEFDAVKYVKTREVSMAPGSTFELLEITGRGVAVPGKYADRSGAYPTYIVELSCLRDL